MDKIVKKLMGASGGGTGDESEDGGQRRNVASAFLAAAKLHDSLSILGFKAWKDVEPGNKLK